MLLQALCVISKLSVNSNWSYSLETPNLGQNRRFFFVSWDIEIWWPWKIVGHLFCATSSFARYFKAIGEFKLDLPSENAHFAPIGHLSYAATIFVPHSVAIGGFKLELQSVNTQFGSNSAIFVPCDLEIWQIILKNNRAPLLCYFKLGASFRSHL